MLKLPWLIVLLCPAVLSGSAGSQMTGLGRLPSASASGTSRQGQENPDSEVYTGFVTLWEVNDTGRKTAFTVHCTNKNQQESWATLTTKHVLIPTVADGLGLPPGVTIQLGDGVPTVLPGGDVAPVGVPRATLGYQALGFGGDVERQIVDGLNAGQHLTIRVNRAAGGQALVYTFAAEQFLRRCGGLASRPPAPQSTPPLPVAGSAAPRFTRWYFTTCRDAGSGAVRTGLLAGRAHLCDLVIETVHNGAQPVSATFSYELEYREGNVVGKLKLDTVDRWPAVTGPVTRYRASGNQLIFTLPLNVRARPDRLYTSINVTAEVLFSNGSRKKVYEPLPVGPAY